jgi:DNA modification methylase
MGAVVPLDLEKLHETAGVADPPDAFRGLIKVGDCTELMPEFPGPDSVDLLLTDPPYFIGANLGTGDTIGVINASYFGQYVAHERWAFKALPCLKHTANIVVFEHPKNLDIVREALRRMGLHILGFGVWVAPMRQSFPKKRPMNLFDVWVHAVVCAEHYYYDTNGLMDAYYLPAGRDDVPGVPKLPGQKPVSMLRKMVEAMCPERGFVFDPFLGSGSTGRAAREAGRPWGGVEFGEKNLALIRSKALSDVPFLEDYDTKKQV